MAASVNVKDLYMLIDSGASKEILEQALNNLRIDYCHWFQSWSKWYILMEKINNFPDCMVACHALNRAVSFHRTVDYYIRYRNVIQRDQVKYLVLRRVLSERRTDLFWVCVDWSETDFLVSFMRWYTLTTNCWAEFNKGHPFQVESQDPYLFSDLRIIGVSDWLIGRCVENGHHEIAIELIENAYVTNKSLVQMIKKYVNDKAYHILLRLFQSKIVRARVDWVNPVSTLCRSTDMPKDGQRFIEAVLTEEPIAKIIPFSNLPDWLEKLLWKTNRFLFMQRLTKRSTVPSLQEACRTSILGALSGYTIKEREAQIQSYVPIQVLRSYLCFRE